MKIKTSIKNKAVILAVTTSLLLGTVGVSFADSEPKIPTKSNIEYNKDIQVNQENEIDLDDLKQYVHRSNDGTLNVDIQRASETGYDKELLESLQIYLDSINKSVVEGELKTDENLNIIDPNQTKSRVRRSARSGGVDKVEKHWWGVSRYICESEIKNVTSALNSAAYAEAGVAGTSGMIALYGYVPAGVVSGIATLEGAYLGNLATRIDANDEGNGVVVHMTWALIFNVEPQ